MSLYALIRPLLFLLDPERAHHVTLDGLNFLAKHAPSVLQTFCAVPRRQVISCFGLNFPNPVGLAAGLDKNGDYIDALAYLGFGFIEVGTTTPKPQDGNPTPRLMRLVKQRSLLNRMGFNNLGVDHLVNAVKASRWVRNGGIIGINIGKNASTPIENAYLDYVFCLERVYDIASYVVVNISSPNTQNLRTLQYGDELRQLLRALKAKHRQLKTRYQKHVPLLVKIAPDLSGEEVIECAQIFLDYEVDGVIASNTTTDKSQLPRRYMDEAGGVSGAYVRERANHVLSALHAFMGDDIPLIGVGGIHSAADAFAKKQAGASLIQLYTGLIYQGPGLVKSCAQGFI